MSKSLAVVMDPIELINPKKDTTLAFLLEAQSRGYTLHYVQMHEMYIRDGKPRTTSTTVTVANDLHNWFAAGDQHDSAMTDFDFIFMRKDPPFDMNYVYATYLLERAANLGAKVVNDPRSIRDCNEKLFISSFPQCCTPTLITSDPARLKAFISEHGKVVVKPLDGMGGASIFVIDENDINLSVIIETMIGTNHEPIMAQKHIPEIVDGDKRILMINGEPIDYALARIPKKGESRGNLAAGGTGEGRPLTERDRWIAAQVGPELKRRGLWFVGLDVIGDYLTEINVTSPTCVRELDAQFNLNIAGQLFDALETHYRA